MQQLEDWLFDAPWWLILACGLVAAVFVVWALPRRDKLVIRLGGVALVLVLVWAGLTWFIETPKERALARTYGLIDSFEAGNWARFDALLDPETRFFNSLVGSDITEAARLTSDSINTRNIRVTDTEVNRDDVGIVVNVRVLSEHEGAVMRSGVTAWKFDFRERAGEWKLEHIDPLSTDRYEAENLMKFIEFPDR